MSRPRVEVALVAKRMRPRLPLNRQNVDLYPLFAFARPLGRRGVSIRAGTWEQTQKLRSGGVLCIDSRAVAYRDGRVSREDLDRLATLRPRFERIVWLDNRDSAGTTQFEVLPLVDVYCKKQYMRDRSLYRRSFYAGRHFADHYHREYGVEDEQPEIAGEPLPVEEETKLRLHWNLAYRPSRHRNSTELYAHLYLPFLPARGPRFVPWSATDRDIDLQARYGIPESPVVGFQRRSLEERIETLPGLETRTGRAPRREYLQELERTAAVLSPFGWGEICVRDFEAFIAGAALIKPDISHLETWPDLFVDGVSYLAIPWDPDAGARKTLELLHDRDLLREVAVRGQEEFRKLWTPDGMERFCDRFVALLTE